MTRWLIYGTSRAVLATILAAGAGSAIAATDASTNDTTATATVSELMVTAEKRTELEVNVPVSVSSFSGERLQKANIVSDLQLESVTPGVRIDQYGVFVIPTIRGVGTNTLGQGLSPVSIYLDGVYQMDVFGQLFDFPNVSQIQVLKGPQGTLFGRNTEAGAILVTTLDPTNHFDFRALGDVGSYGDRKANIYISGPLVGDVLSANLDVYARHSDGYLHNVFTGSNTDGQVNNIDVMGKLLWKPTDKVSILAKLSYWNDTDQSANNYVAAVDTATGLGFATGNYVVPKPGQPPVCVATAPYSTCSFEPPQEHVISWQGLLKGTFDFGWATLTSYSSFSDDHDTNLVEQDSTNYNLATYHWHVREQTIQQEFDLNGRIPGKVDWVVGAYFAQDRTFDPSLNIGCVPLTATCLSTGASIAKDTDYAGFGDATVQVVHNLFIDLGVRYSVEPKSTQNLSLPQYVVPGEIFITAFPGVLFRNTFTSTTPKASIRYQLGRNTNIYYTYSVGFKSGTFNTSGFGPTAVKPETLYSHEVGFKTQTGRFHLDVAGYYYNYDDLQFQNSVNVNGVVKPVLSSAGNALIYGAEFSLQYALSDEFSLDAGVNLNRARYTSFNHAIILYPCSAANIALYAAKGVAICGGKVDNGEYQNSNVNVSGDQMIRAPAWTLSFGPDYRKRTSVGVFELAANLYASARVFFQPDDNPLFSTGPFATLDLNASWSPNEHYKLTLWGTNVTNTKYLDTSSPDTVSARLRYAPPAMGGATFSYMY